MMIIKTKIMAKDKKKSEGPSCACGRPDYLEEWKKNNNQATDDLPEDTEIEKKDSKKRQSKK